MHILLKTRANNAVPAFTLKRRSVLYQRTHLTAKPPLKKKVFIQYPFGGGEGSRTPVRKMLAEIFSERSLCFNIPLPLRPQTG